MKQVTPVRPTLLRMTSKPALRAYLPRTPHAAGLSVSMRLLEGVSVERDTDAPLLHLRMFDLVAEEKAIRDQRSHCVKTRSCIARFCYFAVSEVSEPSCQTVSTSQPTKRYMLVSINSVWSRA